MDEARPGIARAQQLLEGELPTFVEGADGGLVDEVRAARIDESLDDGVAHLQGAVDAPDAGACQRRIPHVVVGPERRVAERRLRLAVPDFQIELLCEPLEIAAAVVVRIVVIAGDGHRAAQCRIVHQRAAERADPGFVGDHDLDGVIQRLLLCAVEADAIALDAATVLSRPVQVRRSLVDAGIDVIHHVAIRAVRGQDGVLVPGVDLVVGVRPARCIPAQDAHLERRVQLPGVGRELKARVSVHVGGFACQSHAGRNRTGGVVAVVAHFDLDVRHERPRAAEQDLEHLRVFFGMLGLVVHQELARAVGTEHAETLEREPVHVAARDGVAIQRNAGRRPRDCHGLAGDRSGSDFCLHGGHQAFNAQGAPFLGSRTAGGQAAGDRVAGGRAAGAAPALAFARGPTGCADGFSRFVARR